MEVETAFFKFAVKCSFASDLYKIIKVSLMQNLQDILGDILPDNFIVKGVKCWGL